MEYQNTFQWNESISGSYYSCWKYENKAKQTFPLHCHSYYELSYVTKGSRTEYYNGKYHEVEEGSLFFLTPLTVHGFTNQSDVNDMILQFSPDFLQANATAVSPNTILTLQSEEKPFIQVEKYSCLDEILTNLYSLCNDVTHLQQENTISLNGQIQHNLSTSLQLLQLINHLLEIGFLTFRMEERSYSDIASLDTVINHILSHPENMPTMEEAARMANISYYHFSRLFKKATGFNYNNYCNHLRIQYAQELLLHSDLSIAEITSAVGLETNSGLTRLFKRTVGISPMQYRKQEKRTK